LQRQKIVNYLASNEEVKAIISLAQLLGVKQGRARVLLSQLVADGVVIKEGGNRNRTYRLKS
jgi:predicted ArsR family transcriptional regulator